MKDENGYIFLNVLILIMIIIILITSHMDSLVMHNDLSKSRLNQVKAYNSSESKVLQVLEVDKYRENLIMKYILKTLRTRKYRNFDFHLDNKDLINNDINTLIELGFDKDLNMRSRPNNFHIKTYSKVGKSNSNLIANVIITNDIFTSETPLIIPESQSLLNDNIIMFFEKFKTERDILFNGDNNFLNIKDENSRFLQIFTDENKDVILLKDGDKYIHLYDEFLKIISINPDKANLYIENYMDVNNIIRLRGIIYIEGNLIINNNFDFEGIIIVKDGKIIIDEEYFFKNQGLIISNNSKVLDFNRNIDLKYDEDIIFKIGPYLPGYIDFKIKNIREE